MDNMSDVGSTTGSTSTGKAELVPARPSSPGTLMQRSPNLVITPLKPVVSPHTGDSGYTLLNSDDAHSRVRKTDTIIEAVGDLEELIAHLAVTLEHVSNPGYLHPNVKAHQQIRTTLLGLEPLLQSIIKFIKNHKATLKLDLVGSVDTDIAGLKKLKVKNTKAHPTVGIETASMKLCWTVCRRAERRVLQVLNTGLYAESNTVEAKKFMNRLSDWIAEAASKLEHSV